MKKRVFAVVCAMLLVASFTSVPEVKAGGLCCGDLTGCGGSECCGGNGKGGVSGCKMTCETGTTIICSTLG
jgi:hypothetical protein